MVGIDQKLLPPKPKIYYNKCGCCGTPVLYPYQICNDCVKQGVQMSGMILPATKKKLRKIAPKPGMKKKSTPKK